MDSVNMALMISAELRETESEISRHHRDFEQISKLAEEAYLLISQLPVPRDNSTREALTRNIRSIRNIVG